VKFVPVVYEHAAALIGRRPYEVAYDPALLAGAHAEAFRRYHHDPVVPGIDVYNVEAEAYGARLRDAGGIAIPSIAEPLISAIDGVFELPPIDVATSGRFPLVLEAATRLRVQCHDTTIAVPLSGPFSIVQNLLGMEELLFSVVAEPDRVRDALMVVAKHTGELMKGIAKAGFDVIVFESSASPPLLSPAMFRSVESPALNHLGHLHRELYGKGIALILGGNTLPVLEDLLATGAGSIICPAEVDIPAFLGLMQPHPEVAVRINMRPGGFALSVEEAREEASRILKHADVNGNQCIGSGVLPFDANPDTVVTIQRFVEGYNL
jgi:uroporphyrinogen decarboxylase